MILQHKHTKLCSQVQFALVFHHFPKWPYITTLWTDIQTVREAFHPFVGALTIYTFWIFIWEVLVAAKAAQYFCEFAPEYWVQYAPFRLELKRKLLYNPSAMNDFGCICLSVALCYFNFSFRCFCHFQSILLSIHPSSQTYLAVICDPHMSVIACCNLWPNEMSIARAQYAEQLLRRVLWCLKVVCLCLIVSIPLSITHTLTNLLPQH